MARLPRYISYAKFSLILRDFHHHFRSRNSPTTGILHTCLFTGVCGPPEKLSLALVLRTDVLRMIMKLAY